ncbi:MAG: diphosphomevalonate decarboxylase, partial [Woeseiaceae bacterium]
PAVGSISITLRDLFTKMQVELDSNLDADSLSVNDSDDAAMLPRLSACLDLVIGNDRPRANIVSHCNFPIAAGLASSASAFAAITIAAAGAAGRTLETAELANLAGRSSGSAARSLYGGFVELENRGDDVALHSLRDRASWPLEIVVAITTKGPKTVGSTEAMEISRMTSPFYSEWVEKQEQDLTLAREAIRTRDFQKLAAVAEHNCLKMHSMMWASRPPTVFWNSTTMRCLQTVRQLQRSGFGVFFTIDAGPQVKAVCLPEHAEEVHSALATTDGVADLILTGLGDAARLLDAE